jgi:hypothetical protein
MTRQTRCAFLFLSLTLRLSLVWIIGHVPSGWDGSNALEAPSNLCEYRAFIVLYTRLANVFHHSLPDVSPFKPCYLVRASSSVSDISVDRYSPHVIASASSTT